MIKEIRFLPRSVVVEGRGLGRHPHGSLNWSERTKEGFFRPPYPKKDETRTREGTEPQRQESDVLGKGETHGERRFCVGPTH